MEPIAIDVRDLVRRNVASLYSHLVTRPTGRAVRLAIEAQLGEHLGDPKRPVLSTIDLSEVAVLDYSCADEVVAKLLTRYRKADRPFEVFFVFRTIDVHHLETLEEVLRRQRLTALVEASGGDFALVGALSEDARALWHQLDGGGSLRGGALAEVRGRQAEALQSLMEERLLLELDGGRELSTLANLARRLR
ncbi:MAG: hypothetical protein R3E10_19085 [Gemmatimonadota bacterium]